MEKPLGKKDRRRGGGREDGGQGSRRKEAGRAQWVMRTQSCWVPGWKAGKYPESLENTPSGLGGYIRDGQLFAVAAAAEQLQISEHTPRHTDSAYFHPETMRLTGLTIAQPIFLQNIGGGKVVAKCWPASRLDIDQAALARPTLLSLGASEGGLVKVEVLSRPFCLPVAVQLHLQPCSSLNFPVTDSFRQYVAHVHDGYYLCSGNFLTVHYYGEEWMFVVAGWHSRDDCSAGHCQTLSTYSLDESVTFNLSCLSLGSDSPLQPAPSTSPPSTSPPGAGPASTSPPGTGPPDSGSPMLSTGPGTPTAIETSTPTRLCATPTGRAGVVQTAVQGLVRVSGLTRVVIAEARATTTQAGKKKRGFSDVGGLQQHVQLLRELVLYPLSLPQSTELKGMCFPRGVLLSGPAGVGKSLLAEALAGETSSHSVFLSAAELTVSAQDSDRKLQLAFQEARENAPCLLVVDDLHCVCPRRDRSPSETERRASATLAALLDHLHLDTPPAHVVVIATTSQIDVVEPCLRRPGRFDKEVEVTVPNGKERRQILELLLSGVSHSLSSEDMTRLAESAHGHVGADLYAVCMEARLSALRRAQRGEGGLESVCVSCDDVWVALRQVPPSAMREVAIQVPKVLWSDIGGQEGIKQQLKEAVEWPLRHPEAFSRLGIRPPRGVLLYGPPGCSKTMIAQALATESGLNFLSVKGPELFSKWVGDSERAVRQVFSRARGAAPAIIFFDEIDALAVQRKSEGSSVGDRVLAQLLTELDGVESIGEVLVVMATNRPDLIDKALLRPGRMDRMVYVPLPSPDTRREIFELQFRKTPVHDSVSLEQLVERTQGFSGAEVVSVVREAALCAMHENIDVEQLSWQHLEQALSGVKPQTCPSTVQFYASYHKTAGLTL